MDHICEELMLESIKEMDEIDDEIYSESMFYLVDEYIDNYVNEYMTNIFNSDSDNTVYTALLDLINSPIRDETDNEHDSDFSYIDWAPLNCDNVCNCSEEDLRTEFVSRNIKDHSYNNFNDNTEYSDIKYDSIFGDTD